MAASSSIRPLFITLFCVFLSFTFSAYSQSLWVCGEVSQIVGGLSMSSQWALWYCKCVHFGPFSLCATVCMLYPEQQPASMSIHFVLAFVQCTFLWLRVDVCFMGKFLQALEGALSRKSYWNKSCLCYYYCYCLSSGVVHSSGFGPSFGKTFVHTLVECLSGGSLTGRRAPKNCLGRLFFFSFLHSFIKLHRWDVPCFALCAFVHLFAQHCPRVVAILSQAVSSYRKLFFCVVLHGENTNRALKWCLFWRSFM